jgi:glucans biosynthesis protein
MVRRRAILKSAVVLAAGQWARPEFASAASSASPPSQPFDYAWLKGQARKLGGNAYQASQDTLPPAMAKLSYDQYQSLRFRTDHALWGNAGLAFRLQFFHVGRSFTEPVRLYEIVDGQSREIVYDRCSNSTRPASIRN